MVFETLLMDVYPPHHKADICLYVETQHDICLRQKLNHNWISWPQSISTLVLSLGSLISCNRSLRLCSKLLNHLICFRPKYASRPTKSYLLSVVKGSKGYIGTVYIVPILKEVHWNSVKWTLPHVFQRSPTSLSQLTISRRHHVDTTLQ